MLGVPNPELEFSFGATIVDRSALALGDDACIRFDFIGGRAQCGSNERPHAGIRGTNGFLHRNKIAPTEQLTSVVRESLGVCQGLG